LHHPAYPTSGLSLKYRQQTKDGQEVKHQLKSEIHSLTDKITKARDLVVEGDLEPADIKKVKQDWEWKIVILESKLEEANKAGDNIEALQRRLLRTCNLYFLYVHGNTAQREKSLVRPTVKGLKFLTSKAEPPT
jgi:predicted RNase H-like nuclease (RuvC/YqgF family)